MKKMLMTVALCGLAMAGSAQKNMSQMNSQGSKTDDKRTRLQEVKFVAELTSQMIANNELVKFSMDGIVEQISRDAVFLEDMKQASRFRYESAGQALNILGSHGWEVVSVYLTKGRQGDVVHYVLSCSKPATPPYSPWSDPNFKATRKR